MNTRIAHPETDLLHAYDEIFDANGKAKALLVVLADLGNGSDQETFATDHDAVVATLYVVSDLLSRIDHGLETLDAARKQIGGGS